MQKETTHETACGVFGNKATAEGTVDDLVKSGFSREQISVMMRDDGKSHRTAADTGNMAAEDAGTGAGIGVVLGGGAGILAGLGLLAIPGLGPFLAAGPIIAGITGAVVGGGIGAIAGALIGMGIPENEARAIQERVRQGGVLVTVLCDGQCDQAMSILKRRGAEMMACTSPLQRPTTQIIHDADRSVPMEHLRQPWEPGTDRPEDLRPEFQHRDDMQTKEDQ